MIMSTAAFFQNAPPFLFYRSARMQSSNDLQEKAPYDIAQASKMYQQAVAITKKYGPGSQEARLAWEIVDDIENKGSAIKVDQGQEYYASLSDEKKVSEFETHLQKLTNLTMNALLNQKEIERLLHESKELNHQVDFEVASITRLNLPSSLLAQASIVKSGLYLEAKEIAEETSIKYGKDSEEAKRS
jgi:hypothetical protein